MTYMTFRAFLEYSKIDLYIARFLPLGPLILCLTYAIGAGNGTPSFQPRFQDPEVLPCLVEAFRQATNFQKDSVTPSEAGDFVRFCVRVPSSRAMVHEIERAFEREARTIHGLR